MCLQTPFAYFSLSKLIRVQPLPGGSGRPASAVKIEDGADEETDLQRWEREYTSILTLSFLESLLT